MTTGEKRFANSLFGYKKQDVYNFIDKLAKDLEEQIKVKDDELATLRNQNKDLKSQVEELSSKLQEIENGRTYIANAIIKAEEQAKNIVEDAIREAERKKEELQEEINLEKNKLENAKQQLKELRLQAINIMRKFELQLVELTEEGEDESDGMQREVAAAAEDTGVEA
ncbi:MAG: hypothetical protein PWP27_1868 [Clostridiales bacterium]|nr:hypothetical protein [Clostridiales bacterium]MDK2934058.1 hypothetical protein [Clostridiales bacterium]